MQIIITIINYTVKMIRLDIFVILSWNILYTKCCTFEIFL